MRFKSLNINIFYILFLVLLLINDSFFYLFSETNLTFIVSAISLILCVFSFDTKYIKSFIFLVPLLIIICGVSIIYSNFAYGQSIIEGINVCHRYLIYLLVLFYLKQIKKESTVNCLIRIVVNVAVVFAIIAFIQYFLYPNVVFFKEYTTRNGNIRLFVNSSCVTFSLIYLLGKIFQEFKTIDLFKLIFLFLFIIFVNQGRGEIMIFFISLVILIFVKVFLSLNKTSRTILLILSPIILAGFLFLFMVLFRNQIDSLLKEINAGSGSGFTRVNELLYYSNLLFKSPVFGIGTLSDDLALKYYMTDELHYYMEDTGVLEFIFKNGLFGLIWIIAYFCFIFKAMITFYKFKKFLYFYIVLYYTLISIIGIFYFNLITSRQYAFMNTLFFSIIYIEFRACINLKKQVVNRLEIVKNYEKNKCC